MPRVDRGSTAVDISVIIALGGVERKELLSEAAELGAILVVKPSIVTVWLSNRPIRVALGVGSLIFPPGAQPPGGLEGFEVSAPEWVEGCRLASSGAVLKVTWLQGDPVTRGPVVPAELENPIALSIAGAYAEVVEIRESVIPLATVNGHPAVGFGDDEIIVAITGGEARRRLEYILSALHYCSDRRVMRLP